jgi:hypothetical protein
VSERRFTPEEANEALSDVRPLVERLLDRRAAQLAANARWAEVRSRIGGNGGGLEPQQLSSVEQAAEEAGRALAQVIEELSELGVVVKDLDAGLVDFPSLRDGESVLLCWQLGEDAVGWWHGLEEGFAGRKPI